MILCIDVGFTATGWATFDGTVGTRDLQLHARACGVIVPTDGLSPKSLNEQRSHEKYGLLCERFAADLHALVQKTLKGSDPIKFWILGEPPAMGAMSAGAMRSMSFALAVYRVVTTGMPRHDVSRNDVKAAIWGKRMPPGDIKPLVRQIVRQRMALDLTGIPEKLHEHVYDAAATLFAARDSMAVRSQGWSAEAMKCLEAVR
jgi:hypothetical protein